MVQIRKLVLDVLKPHNPDITVLAKRIADIEDIDGVNISVYEVDTKVENVKITIEGNFVDTEEIRARISSIGGSVHSIDEVAVGKLVVDEEETLEERCRDVR